MPGHVFYNPGAIHPLPSSCYNHLIFNFYFLFISIDLFLANDDVVRDVDVEGGDAGVLDDVLDAVGTVHDNAGQRGPVRTLEP